MVGLLYVIIASLFKVFSLFKNNGLELTFRQICTNDNSGSVEFLDVNHCIAADTVFGFVTKDFVKPTSVGRRFIHGSSHILRQLLNQLYLEKP